MDRLDKIIAGTGRYSRKEVHSLVKAGRVAVDGRTVTEAGEKFDRDAAAVTVDGALLTTAAFHYLMLHKPAGLITATEDPRKPTVMTLLPEHLRRVGLFPVGRLDKDTEGLLLLTNDGPLAHRLLSPRHHVDKVYYVEAEGAFTQEDAARFREGLTLRDGLVCRPAELEVLEPPSAAHITLREGKYHQIKRMCASLGKPVTYLKRLSMGPIVLDEALEKGAWRPLTPQEVAQLKGLEGIT